MLESLGIAQAGKTFEVGDLEESDAFMEMGTSGRRALRALMSDRGQIEAARRQTSDMEVLKANIRALPIFESYLDFDSPEPSFCALTSGPHYLPPSDSIDKRLLDTGAPTFIRTSGVRDELLLDLLGVGRIDLADFYRDYVLKRVASLAPDLRSSATTHMLGDLQFLERLDPHFSEALRASAFVPDASGDTSERALRRPCDLYDPNVTDLVDLLRPEAFPAKELCTPDAVAKLRKLGLKSSLSLSGQSPHCRGREPNPISLMSGYSDGGVLLPVS